MTADGPRCAAGVVVGRGARLLVVRRPGAAAGGRAGALPRPARAACSTWAAPTDPALPGCAAPTTMSRSTSTCAGWSLATGRVRARRGCPSATGPSTSWRPSTSSSTVSPRSTPWPTWHACCAPGGRLLVSVPAYQWAWSQHDVRAGHHRRYTRPRIVAAIERAGLRVERATYAFAAVFPLFAAERVLRRAAPGAAAADGVAGRRPGAARPVRRRGPACSRGSICRSARRCSWRPRSRRFRQP